jgi:hypothetical protein
MTRTRLSRHVSYANVMATMAVFIALGGTGYAMSQINGSQIKNRSIPAQKLKPHTLTASQIKKASLLGQDLAPHTVTSDELRDLIVSAKGHSARARIAQSGSTAPATIITLSAGQSATIVQSGPFTYSANCTAGSSGQPLVSIQATSTESGSLIQGAFDSTGQLLQPEPYHLTPGQPVVASGAPTSDEWDFLINGAHMLAPSGAALTVQLSYGTNLFGGQCWASGYGIT